MFAKGLKYIFLLGLTSFTITGISQNDKKELVTGEVTHAFLPDDIKETIKLKHPILDTIVLKHSNNTSIKIDNFIKRDFVLLFEKSVVATLFFPKDTLRELVNYNMIHQKLVTETENGTYSTLNYSPQPDSIHINGKSFVNTKKGTILERIMPASTNFFISYESRYSYDHKTEGIDVQSIKDKYPTGSVSVLLVPNVKNVITTVVFCEAQPYLYYFNGKKYVKINNQKKLLSVLDDNIKTAVSNFLNANNISLNSVNDINVLVNFIYGLNIQLKDINKNIFPKIREMESLSDVDVNIPQSIKTYPDKFALIIGNEDYSSRQSGLSSESNVAFAARDAEIFKKYCIETLGLEERNVFLITNATSAEMNQKIDLIYQIIQRIGNVSDLYFYYAGHGFPDEITKEPYLMPVDVSASYLQAALKLSDVYKKLSESGAKRVTVFLDACFSGGGREAGLLAARAVKVRPKEELISGNLIVFSATSNDQSALPYKDKKHGMFTYFLLKKLQQTNGDVDYGSLDEYLFKNVSIESLRVNNKVQDPKTNVSFDAKDDWKEWSFK